MTISKENLTELREIFRERMEREDFCIGQKQVEKLFRELLGEPEPESIYKNHEPTDPKLIIKAFEDFFGKNHLKRLFERDDTFYRNLKK